MYITAEPVLTLYHCASVFVIQQNRQMHASRVSAHAHAIHMLHVFVMRRPLSHQDAFAVSSCEITHPPAWCGGLPRHPASAPRTALSMVCGAAMAPRPTSPHASALLTCATRPHRS